MRLLSLCAAGAVLAAAGAAEAAEVEVKDAVARVTVIPEARNDIKVEVVRTHPNLPLQVRSLGGKTIVDGDLDRKIKNCSKRGGRIVVSVSGVGEVGYDQMPEIVIRTPRDADVAAGGAVFGSVGRSANLDLSNAGCGDWAVANVDGRLRVNLAGSGDLRAGTAGEARLRVAGSGDIRTKEITGPLQVEVAGSGDVWVASIAGDLDAKIAGSGDVTVAGGQAGAMTASIAGSGDVSFDGVAESLKARVAGSGDVRAREVRGEVSKTVIGSGDVRVGR
jgi:hypothetical protein